MRPTNRKTLAVQYGVSLTLIRKWINQLPEMNLTKGQRVLSPKQIEIFYEYYGRPDGK